MSSPSPEAQRLLDQAAQDYAQHQASAPERQTACTGQLGGAISHGSESAGSWAPASPSPSKRH
ncbi:hypothetical protein DR950_41890 [Kitasatospora xanthocidica]|uniref:Uncharacterized protein n=1 Tax=Kitasatospora xanthocidica TaxID=83382 RepID=A0A372ZHV6_9ACTN|nr:hypothetical protein [Kitasatospora xanthocidica]RGD55418.1 hypothetical protein DR950_41890 [Kitasatospora xanthocidica]